MAQPDRLPIDLEIKDKQVMLKDEDGRLNGPYPTRRIIDGLDLSLESLRMIQARFVQEPPKGSDGAKGSEAAGAAAAPKPRGKRVVQPAICQIVNKAENRQRELRVTEERKAKAKQAGKHKEVEINWAIAPHDLGVKLGRMRAFLEKGYRVDVMLAKKRGARPAKVEEMEALARNVKEAVGEVKGARERKSSQGQVGQVMKFFLEGQGS